ncbi:MAG: TIM barrel protein [Thermoleophilaceae bacterium]
MPALLDAPSPVVSRHLSVGCSTGFMVDQRGDWVGLVARSGATPPPLAGLSALSQEELPGLIRFLRTDPSMPFHYLSVHAPSKGVGADEAERVRALMDLPSRVRAIVVHPDTMEDLKVWSGLGRRLVVENMDARKNSGQTADQLADVFRALPLAGLCLDIAHAKHVDPSLKGGRAMLDRFAGRLRHVHLSSLDDSGHHVPLTAEDAELFTDLLERCRDVPWILEAPLR